MVGPDTPLYYSYSCPLFLSHIPVQSALSPQRLLGLPLFYHLTCRHKYLQVLWALIIWPKYRSRIMHSDAVFAECKGIKTSYADFLHWQWQHCHCCLKSRRGYVYALNTINQSINTFITRHGTEAKYSERMILAFARKCHCKTTRRSQKLMSNNSYAANNAVKYQLQKVIQSEEWLLLLVLWMEIYQWDGHVHFDVVDRCKAGLQELGYFAQDWTEWNKASDSNRCWSKYDDSMQELSNTECVKRHL